MVAGVTGDRVRDLIIVQAREGSTRLPKKILKHLVKNETCLSLLCKRLNESTIDYIVSTGENYNNSFIINTCQIAGIPYYSGSENNLVERYLKASHSYDNLNYIVRVTGDNPLVGIDVIEYSLDYAKSNNIEFASCYFDKNWPNGTVVSVFTRNALAKIKEISFSDARVSEHIIFGLESLYGTNKIVCPDRWSAEGVRYCLDDENDLIRLRKICSVLSKNDNLYKSSTELIIQEAYKVMDIKEIDFYAQRSW